MQTFLQDLRYGLRVLSNISGFPAVAVITLALGIGANTAIFSVVNAALLRPLPYEDPSRLVYVWSAEKARGINESTVSIPDLQDWREQGRAFVGMAGWWSGTYNLSGGNEAQHVEGWTVSPNFFHVLGARSQLGRKFALDEEQGTKDRVVVLSHSLWIGSFGGTQGVLGRTITLDGEPHPVVGAMLAGFSALLVLLGAVAFVLLIGCNNLVSLLLARSAAREKEFAIRAALGADRWDLVRQLLTESVLLSVLGGAAWILIAAWAVRYLRVMVANQVPRAQDISLDAPVLLFTVG